MITMRLEHRPSRTFFLALRIPPWSLGLPNTPMSTTKVAPRYRRKPTCTHVVLLKVIANSRARHPSRSSRIGVFVQQLQASSYDARSPADRTRRAFRCADFFQRENESGCHGADGQNLAFHSKEAMLGGVPEVLHPAQSRFEPGQDGLYSNFQAAHQIEGLAQGRDS